MRKSRIMESSSSRGGEGWANGPILQTIAAHLTKMKHWTRFNKDAPVAWYSYTYKFFGSNSLNIGACRLQSVKYKKMTID
jgi:hypothetical protein